MRIKSCLIKLLKSVHPKILGTYNTSNNKKILIPVFESLFDEGAVREIGNFAMDNNEDDYILVLNNHKINFYKTTKVRVSTDLLIW
uniref:Uncharacterized protein n=1 Tax=Lactuca sativa TaxID=4236 RepID=A0A9R1WFR3_LACSA|nr:hypothetical protein LSAT_V11C200064160 [Lactuca sativa]